jgi:N-acetylmuramoyl-L-alanine amidase
MPADATRRSKGAERGRQALLQGVYQDNLNVISQRTVKSKRSDFVPKRRISIASVWGGGALLMAAVIILGLLGSRADQETTGVSPTLVTPSVAAASPVWQHPAPLERDLTTATLYGLEVRTIVIDPGHGGRDPGAVGQLGTFEKDLALQVAHILRRRLERYPGYRILLTREEDVRMTKSERVAFANENDADLFISLHFNSIPDRAVTSVETYYFGTTSDEAILRKVERENRESGYSMAEFREMVQRLATDIKLEESRRLADSIQESLYSNMRLIDTSLRDWGVKTAPFVVLLGVEAPSVLAELACLSNLEEEIRLNSEEHLESLATFLEEGIVRYLHHPPLQTPHQ